MKKVFFDASPLQTGHAHRGIGAYTRALQAALRQVKEIELVSKPEQADIIHYPYFDFFSPTLPLTHTAPTVVTIHDVIPLMFSRQYPAGIKGTLSLWKQKLALNNVKLIVTDSQASQHEITRKLGITKSKIKVVPLAADPKLVYQDSKSQQKATRQYDLPDEFILYVGDINYNKNLPLLIESFAKVRATYSNLKLVLVGKNFRPQTIPEWKAVTSTIEINQVSDSVIFITNVDKLTDLAAIYSQAKVYIQASMAEGFGLPILEAMQCHCPVVCFKQSSMVEVGGEHAVYPETETATGLANAVKTVLDWSGVKRHRWVATAYSWSRTFTWQKTAQQMAKIYNQL